MQQGSGGGFFFKASPSFAVDLGIVRCALGLERPERPRPLGRSTVWGPSWVASVASVEALLARSLSGF